MQIKSGQIWLTQQEAAQLQREINREGCKLCTNALALGSGRRVCSKGLTFPKCYDEGSYRLTNGEG